MRSDFLIYSAGLGALLFADLLVSRYFLEGDIADWALLRSLVGISAVVPVIGLDQVLVRRPAASAQLLRLLAFQVPALALIVGVVLLLAGILPNWWIGVLLAIGSATSLVQFQYFRSHHKRVLAQTAQQGWKISALAMVCLMVITGESGNLILLGVLLILSINAMIACAMLHFPPSRLHQQATEDVRDHYSIGSRFMVTALLLALSVYAEQIIVNRLGTTAEAALYFTSATYFLFSISFVNGYLAFLIGPWIRGNHDRFIQLLRTRRIAIVGFSAATAAVLNILGWVLWQIVSPTSGEPDGVLQALFFLMAFVRTLYALPSGYLGVFGMPRQHDTLIILQVVSLLPVISLFLGLRAAGIDLLHSVAAASALNWICRTVVGYGMTSKVIRLRSEGLIG